jgi:hypothetical protein
MVNFFIFYIEKLKSLGNFTLVIIYYHKTINYDNRTTKRTAKRKNKVWGL